MRIKKISIIIPIFNERDTLVQVIERVEKANLGGREKEIILVDDGSVDGTRKLLKKYESQYKVIYHKQNLGKGAAIRSGLQVATGDYIIIQDADLEYNPQDIKVMLAEAEKTGNQVIYGSRILGQDKNKTSNKLFYFGGRFITFLTNLLYGTRITDEPTCYKMFSREVARQIKIESNGFEFCPEVTAKFSNLGYSILEVPISYNPRNKQQGKKIKPFKDGLKAVWTLLKYRFFAINYKKFFQRDFILKNKWWYIIISLFILVRIFIFASFWQATQDRGGWEVFYRYAEPSHSVFARQFHEPCDWHPPLYYTLTSVLLFFFKNQWSIYIVQNLLALFTVVIAFKAARFFFSRRVSLMVAGLLAVEPYWAWHNFMLSSENLSTPLLLISFYYLFKYLKREQAKDLYFSSFFLGLSTLTRANTLLLPAVISFLFLSVFILKKKLKLNNFKRFTFKRFIGQMVIFNLVFLAVLFPWAWRNKLVYDRFTIANMLSTNIYFYNLPPLLALQKNISYVKARDIIKQKAKEDLGIEKDVGDKGDCFRYSVEELNRQLDYYKSESRKMILANFPLYLKMHFIRALPFFLQPGYYSMIALYGPGFHKPDITGLFLKKSFAGIIDFFHEINFMLIIYLLGIAFWGLTSLAVFLSLVYSYFKDRDKFLFFILINFIIIYNALLISPFVLARYRLPILVLFFIPLVYMINILNNKFKKDER